MFISSRSSARPTSPVPNIEAVTAAALPQSGTAPTPLFTRFSSPLAVHAQRCAWATGMLGIGWSLAAVCAPAATASFTAAPIAYKVILGASAATAAYLACDTVSSASWTLAGVIAGMLYAPAAIPAAGMAHILGSAALGGFTAYHLGKRINTLERGLWFFAAIGTATLTLNAAQNYRTPRLPDVA